VKSLISRTWPNSKRSFAQRARFGVAIGAAEVFDGIVSIVTLGQYASWLAMRVTLELSIIEAKEQEKS
jgi:hypothetical protein